MVYIEREAMGEPIYLIGQRVIVNGDTIGMVMPHCGPFDVRVRLLHSGVEHCYAFHNVKPLPNGEL